MTFENIIKRVSQVLAAAFMFLMADGFYLSHKGFNWVDAAYEEAVKERYRFFSFGDAMFIKD